MGEIELIWRDDHWSDEKSGEEQNRSELNQTEQNKTWSLIAIPEVKS